MANPNIADDYTTTYLDPTGEYPDDYVDARTLASWWHGGQWPVLYSLSWSGHVDRGRLIDELEGNIHDETTRADLLALEDQHADRVAQLSALLEWAEEQEPSEGEKIAEMIEDLEGYIPERAIVALFASDEGPNGPDDTTLTQMRNTYRGEWESPEDYWGHRATELGLDDICRDNYALRVDIAELELCEQNVDGTDVHVITQQDPHWTRITHVWDGATFRGR